MKSFIRRSVLTAVITVLMLALASSVFAAEAAPLVDKELYEQYQDISMLAAKMVDDEITLPLQPADAFAVGEYIYSDKLADDAHCGGYRILSRRDTGDSTVLQVEATAVEDTFRRYSFAFGSYSDLADMSPSMSPKGSNANAGYKENPDGSIEKTISQTWKINDHVSMEYTFKHVS